LNFELLVSAFKSDHFPSDIVYLFRKSIIFAADLNVYT
jgi:hypothetical protein